MDADTLLARIKDGTIDTVQVAAPDPFGKLVGKRFTGQCYAEDVAGGLTHGCCYLFAVNLEMDPQPGYRIADWEKGFGDFEMRVDPAACFLLPWEPGSALVLADFHHHDGRLVEEAPRQILRKQVARLAERGLTVSMASELEFFLYKEDYPAAAARGYAGLTPSSPMRLDYQLLQPTWDEGLMRALRNGLVAAGLPVETTKGEWGRGQHEINLKHASPLVMADRHTLLKQAAKQIAQAHGQSVTFMAKPFHGEAGSSSHLHLSLWEGKQNVFWDEKAHAPSATFRHFLGGLMKYSRELCLFSAPNVNSYKRYESMSWAPTKQAWASDNRTTGLRVVGHGKSFRVENRMPGADCNAYTAYAAMIAAGLAGIEEQLDPGPEYFGNAYLDSKLPALPTALHQSLELFAGSAVAKAAFTPEVVEHYLHAARTEVIAFDAAVTDWERQRYFERI